MMFDPHAPVEVVTLRDECWRCRRDRLRNRCGVRGDEPQRGQFERLDRRTLCADGALNVSLVAGRDERITGHVAFSPVSINGEPGGGQQWYGAYTARGAARLPRGGKASARGSCVPGLDARCDGCDARGDPVHYTPIGIS